MSRQLVPDGGDDRVYTPPGLAKLIVRHFRPTGYILEPCAGRGAFVRAMPGCFTCEIDHGLDFFKWNEPVDWIVTNPPWSQFRGFLQHSLKLADNVVFLCHLGAWFMSARMRDLRTAGFGLVEALLLDNPRPPWPQGGLQLAAVHAQRGYKGPMKFSYPNKKDQP